MGGVVLLLQESVTGRPCTVGIERGVHKCRNSNKEAVHKQRDARHLHAAKQKPCWFLQFLKDVVEPTQFLELVFQTTVNRQPAGDGVNCLHREASIRSAMKGTGMRPQKGICGGLSLQTGLFEATQPLKPPFQATAHRPPPHAGVDNLHRFADKPCEGIADQRHAACEQQDEEKSTRPGRMTATRGCWRLSVCASTAEQRFCAGLAAISRSDRAPGGSICNACGVSLGAKPWVGARVGPAWSPVQDLGFSACW